MKLMRNPRLTSLLKWVLQISVETQYKPPKSGTGFVFNCTQNPSRSFATETAAGNKVINNEKNTRSGIRITPPIRKMAEEVMLDYFYSTRGLQYLVAESMSKNSPIFIDNLLKKVDCVDASDISRFLTRHLRFHPVNEFEPFLESSGLKPTDCNNLVPSDKLFLSDDVLLLENHHVLCYFGIDTKKIGKIFKEAREVFGYETGVLSSKIQAYEGLGFSRLFLLKLIVCSPRILIGDMNVKLVNVLEMLKSMGFGFDWVMKNLSEEESYDWSFVHRVLSLLREIFLHEHELCGLIRKHPRLIFENSGKRTLNLFGDMNVELANVLEMLKSMGFDFDWVMKNLSEEESYDWSSMHRVLSFLRELCVDENELRELISKRPRLIFEDSGEWTLILAGIETKLGSSRSELSLLFQKFPQIQGLGKCVSNLRHCFLFLKDIDMEANEIRKVFRSHSWWLGVSRLKRTSTLHESLRGGKSRLCQVIQENPEVMKKWTMGSKIQPLPATDVNTKSKEMKTQFLLYLGYKENSEEMEKAFKNFRGTGAKLRERFNFLVSLGLNEKDVKDMVKAEPIILRRSCDMLESKVNFLVDELGYPLSTLVAFPSCLRYSLQRMKLRFEMFSWLQVQGKIDPKLAVSTVLVYSDKFFETKYVNRHPDGPKHFEDLKKKLLPCE